MHHETNNDAENEDGDEESYIPRSERTPVQLCLRYVELHNEDEKDDPNESYGKCIWSSTALCTTHELHLCIVQVESKGQWQ